MPKISIFGYFCPGPLFLTIPEPPFFDPGTDRTGPGPEWGHLKGVYGGLETKIQDFPLHHPQKYDFYGILVKMAIRTPRNP